MCPKNLAHNWKIVNCMSMRGTQVPDIKRDDHYSRQLSNYTICCSATFPFGVRVSVCICADLWVCGWASMLQLGILYSQPVHTNYSWLRLIRHPLNSYKFSGHTPLTPNAKYYRQFGTSDNSDSLFVFFWWGRIKHSQNVISIHNI